MDVNMTGESDDDADKGWASQISNVMKDKPKTFRIHTNIVSPAPIWQNVTITAFSRRDDRPSQKDNSRTTLVTDTNVAFVDQLASREQTWSDCM
jgi:hypothetical protein